MPLRKVVNMKVIVMTVGGFELSGVTDLKKLNTHTDLVFTDDNGDLVTVPADRIEYVKQNG